MLNWVRYLSLLTYMLGVTACGHHKYYAVDYTYHWKEILPPVEMGRLRAPDLAVLAKSKVIAFAPASKCEEIAAGSSGQSDRLDLLSTDCGSLMSELEAAAKAAGFSVISWKHLKTPVQRYEKEGDVELLIEVNRIAIHTIDPNDPGGYVLGSVLFFEDFNDGHRQQIAINHAEEIGRLCLSNRAPKLSLRTRYVAVLDAKVIDTRTGKLLTRQIHTWPSRAESTKIATQYYVGYDNQAPNEVICQTDPHEPDWHINLPTISPDTANGRSPPGIGYRFLATKSAKSNSVLILLQNVSQQFIETLISIREAFVAPLAPKSPANKKDSKIPRTQKSHQPSIDDKATATNGGSTTKGNEKEANNVNEVEEYLRSANSEDHQRALRLAQELRNRQPTVVNHTFLIGLAFHRLADCDNAKREFSLYLNSNGILRNAKEAQDKHNECPTRSD